MAALWVDVSGHTQRDLHVALQLRDVILTAYSVTH